MPTKSWFQSKSVWGGIVAMLAGILRGHNINVDDLLPSLLNNFDAVLAFVGGLIAIVGRIRASKLIAPKTTSGLDVAIAALLLPALFFASCAQGPVYTGSSTAAVATDVETAAARAIADYTSVKSGNVNITWALGEAAWAYQTYLKTAPDVKQLISQWAGNSGDAQTLAARLARIFGNSSAPAEQKMAAIAVAAQSVAAAH